MTKQEFIDKYEEMESWLEYSSDDGCEVAHICTLTKRYFNEIRTEFIQTMHPSWPINTSGPWFGQWIFPENQKLRFLALQVFKQHCLANKIWKEL